MTRLKQDLQEQFNEKYHINKLDLIPGTSAEDVLAIILGANPDIDQLNYLIFDPDQASSRGTIVQYEYLPIKPTRLGEELATINSRLDREAYIFYVEEQPMIIRKGIAVCSIVIMNDGHQMHIPMVDFCSTSQELDPDMIKNLGLPPGAVLDSGNGLHYWGYNLMNNEEWTHFMNLLHNYECTRIPLFKTSVFDASFLSISLKRNFAALRLYGYIHTYKNQTPKLLYTV